MSMRKEDFRFHRYFEAYPVDIGPTLLKVKCTDCGGMFLFSSHCFYLQKQRIHTKCKTCTSMRQKEKIAAKRALREKMPKSTAYEYVEIGPPKITRKCNQCSEVKIITAYWWQKKRSTYRLCCLKCSAERNHANYIKNRDRYLMLSRKYGQENKERIAEVKKLNFAKPMSKYKSMLRAAKSRNIEVKLTYLDYLRLYERPCHYCNDEMDHISMTGYRIDRIDNSKGYEVGNVVPCCATCNMIKRELLTEDETKVAIEAILKLRKEKSLCSA